MQEETPSQVEQFKMPKDRISKLFKPGTPVEKMEETIIRALEMYRKRQREVGAAICGAGVVVRASASELSVGSSRTVLFSV